MKPIVEAKPSYIDYREKNPGVLFAKQEKDFQVGDIVVDKYNTMGYVKFISDANGAFIRFIDDREIYQNQVNGKIRKVQSFNINQFNHQLRYFNLITKMGNVMVETLHDHFPHVNMFNDHNVIRIRASTNKAVTQRFTHEHLGSAYNYISFTLKPFVKFHLEEFVVKQSFRKSRFAYKVLRDLFIDLDMKLSQTTRYSYLISCSDKHYNNDAWNRIFRQFKKFNFEDKRGISNDSRM